MKLARFSIGSKFRMGGVLFLAFLFFSSPVAAHRVTIFAWVEAESIHTASKFSNNKPVKGGAVAVYAGEGNPLVTGKTDDGGLFSFAVPAVTDLRIVLDASMGHRAEWLVTAAELGHAQPTREAPAAAGDDYAHAAALTNLSGEAGKELEKLVDALLERRLQPIERALVELRDPAPGLRDVVGGVGYILGLMGAAAYFRYRKK